MRARGFEPGLSRTPWHRPRRDWSARVGQRRPAISAGCCVLDRQRRLARSDQLSVAEAPGGRRERSSPSRRRRARVERIADRSPCRSEHDLGTCQVIFPRCCRSAFSTDLTSLNEATGSARDRHRGRGRPDGAVDGSDVFRAMVHNRAKPPTTRSARGWPARLRSAAVSALSGLAEQRSCRTRGAGPWAAGAAIKARSISRRSKPRRLRQRRGGRAAAEDQESCKEPSSRT